MTLTVVVAAGSLPCPDRMLQGSADGAEEIARMRTQNRLLLEENNMLKYKMDILVDMVSGSGGSKLPGHRTLRQGGISVRRILQECAGRRLRRHGVVADALPCMMVTLAVLVVSTVGRGKSGCQGARI